MCRFYYYLYYLIAEDSLKSKTFREMSLFFIVK